MMCNRFVSQNRFCGIESASVALCQVSKEKSDVMFSLFKNYYGIMWILKRFKTGKSIIYMEQNNWVWVNFLFFVKSISLARLLSLSLSLSLRDNVTERKQLTLEYVVALQAYNLKAFVKNTYVFCFLVSQLFHCLHLPNHSPWLITLTSRKKQNIN